MPDSLTADAQVAREMLAGRRTVRITTSRSTLLHRVDVVTGDDVMETIRITANEDLAEGAAAGAAHVLGLVVTRVDVP